jgi:hypothetical protein
MNGSGLHVADMISYLAASGWRRRPETWRGASVWEYDGYEAVVPARDGLDDSDRRALEVLEVLARVEGRAAEDIADEISAPTMDRQTIRTFPRREPSGYVGLAAGLRALTGIRSMIAVAARSELEGPRLVYRGKHEGADRVLDVVQLGPTRPGSYTFMLRVPARSPDDEPSLFDEGEYLPRRSMIRLSDAVSAAHVAVESSDGVVAFDQTVRVGVSANLCEALSDLAGIGREDAFEIGFRWARSRPLSLPVQTVAFTAGAGLLLRDAATRLRQLDAYGSATITGVVEDLHDDARGGDRWRVKVRGELRTAGIDVPEQRAVWLRLSQADYPRAVEAHLGQRNVLARGVKSQIARRTEIVVDLASFEVLS